MDAHNISVLFGTLLFCCLFSRSIADLPCAALKIEKKSVVCVCNATYCDTITKQPLTPNQYVVYMSSKSGLRFDKSRAELLPLNVTTESECTATLVLNPEKTYQTVEGFGSSVSDAAGINWKNLSEPLQKYLIDDHGLQYNMIRVPIGGTDFSTHVYAYNELPVDDVKLSNFSLSYEDFHYKIPMIRSAMQTSSTPIHVIATTWSPPPWMKTNNAFTGLSQLKRKYYQTYADYHLKFIEQYTAASIPIWGITTTNEPSNGLLGFVDKMMNLGWTARTLGIWIKNNLGPTIRNSPFEKVKILIGDDQRQTLPYWVTSVILKQPEVLNYIDGISVHFYMDKTSDPAILTEIATLFPDKFIISTEACEGVLVFDTAPVLLGEWKRAKNYLYDIIDDFNHGIGGWLDWNICLDIHGSASHVTTKHADANIIVFPDNDTFVKQPMFYAMGHFSKFVPRGSRRIDVTLKCGLGETLWNVAFITPENTVVVVLYNNGKATEVKLEIGSQQAVFQMLASSVATVELKTEL